jgi:phosphoserine phosphatase RsbU/P
MRLRTMLAVSMLLSSTLAVGAQSEIVSVTDWRVHAGDDLSWARPDLDDSSWAATSFPRMAFSDPSAIGWHWYRASFSVPENLRGQQISLGMAALDDVYKIYVEGVPIGRFGSFTPAPHGIYPRHMVFAIPEGLLHGTVTHIAVRRWRGPWSVDLTDSSAPGTANFHHLPQIGSTDAIVAREQLDLANGAIQMLPTILTCILFLVAAAISVVLFSAQRRRAEYFYLALFCLTRGAPHFAGLFASTSPTIDSRSWGPVLTFFVTSCSHVFSGLFLATLCPRFRRILLTGAAASAVIAALLAYGMAMDSGYERPVIFLKDALPVAFQMVAVWGLLRDRQKGSLTIGVSLFLDSAIWVWAGARVFMRVTPKIVLGPFFLDYRDAAGVAFIFVVLVVLYLRYREEQVRQAATEQNLAAARRMQEQLLGAGVVDAPGYAIEAVYRPAQEVGGDFYRTVPLKGGSLLVVVGDVSGKGLDAAMLVAAVLGGLANETERNPALLLEYLNQAVLGRTGGGFVTACCARFYPDGRVVIANAGHISPYLDGRELHLENGFPLGVTAQAAYSETEIQAAGTMTFLSDGVAEARNTKGELLGFERMAALTAKPAAEIADAAQRWGQEDDITVVTVKRLGFSIA